MEEKRPEKEERVVSPSLIRPWPDEKFKYYPKFDLGIGAEWMGTSMGTADNIDVGVDDMTSLLDFGFEVDLSVDMSVFDSCLDSEESTVDCFNITTIDSA